MKCSEASRLYSESKDRRLGLWQWLKLRYHLFICAACRRFGWQIETLDRVARTWTEAEDDIGPELPSHAKQRILTVLQQADADGDKNY